MNDKQEEAANSAYEDADDDDFEFKSTVLIANLDEIELVAEQEKETSHHYFIQIKSQLSRISFLKGYFFILLFAFCVSLSAIFIKLSKSLAGSENSTVRYLVQLVMMSSIILYKKESFLGPKNMRKWLVARGLIGSSSVVLGYFALKYIDPSDFSTLNNCSVIVTAIIARIYLKEKLTSFHFIATLFSLCGIFFILRPAFLFAKIEQPSNNESNITIFKLNNKVSRSSSDTALGVILVVTSAVTLGVTHVIIKKLCTFKVHYSVVSFYPAVCGIPMGAIISVVLFFSKETHQNFEQYEKSHLAMDIFFSIIAGILGSVALIFLNIALDCEDANRFAIVKTTDVFFSFLLQFFILGINVDYLGVIGALFILTSTFGISIVKSLDEKFSSRIEKNICLKYLFHKF